MNPILASIQSILYLSLVNPAEATGIYLVNKCDAWVCTERRFENGDLVGMEFIDLQDDIKILVDKILKCADVQYAKVGEVFAPVLDELDRADYRLEIIPSINQTNQCLYYIVQCKPDRLLISGYTEMPITAARQMLR